MKLRRRALNMRLQDDLFVRAFHQLRPVGLERFLVAANILAHAVVELVETLLNLLRPLVPQRT